MNVRIAALAAELLVASQALAQERLVGRHSAGGGLSVDVVSFGGGLRQFAFAGLDSALVTGVTQVTLPVAAATPLAGGWRLDITALHAQGSVRYRDARGGSERRASLGGMSDVRLRATGRLLSDAVTVTVGTNVPTGRTDLDGTQFSALRILAAPALALGSTPVGTGPSGTVGAVVAQGAGPWSLAFGASYEHRGTYQPIAALSAGAPSADFRPGAVIRASVGAERLVGAHRLNLALATDVFAEDRLRGLSGVGGPSATLATVRLGPVFTADAQVQLANAALRDLVVYSSYLWRAPYARDGITAAGSSGHYVEGGVRAGVPLRPRAELVLATGAKWHSGLQADEGLTTAGVRAADLTVGVRARRGLLSAEPFLRAQAGSLRMGAGPLSSQHPGFRGFAAGLVMQGRF